MAVNFWGTGKAEICDGAASPTAKTGNQKDSAEKGAEGERWYEKFFCAGKNIFNIRIRRIGKVKIQFGKKYIKGIDKSIIAELPLTLNSTPDMRAEWVEKLSTILENRFNEKTIKNIRQGCYCNENGRLEDTANSLKQLYLSLNKDLSKFIKALNEMNSTPFVKQYSIL